MKNKQDQQTEASLVPAGEVHEVISSNIIPIQESEEPSKQVRVICESLRVRKNPSKEADILFMVKKDDLLERIQNEEAPDDWINAIFNEKSGWVMKEFTEEV